MSGHSKRARTWIGVSTAVGIIVMGAFAALGAKITIDAYHSQSWAESLRIGPITFVGGLNAAAIAAATFRRCVIDGERVPEDIWRLLPFWWSRLMQAALIVSVICLITGFVGDVFQAPS